MRLGDIEEPMSLHVKIYTDGGARGNPGPAAAGVVLITADDDTVIHEAGIYLGEATNNVAEYSAMLAGLEAAEKLNVTKIDLFSDSQLMVRQMNGQYRVKNAGLKPLFDQAIELSGRFEQFKIHFIRREKNKQADKLVNHALDLKRNV